MPRYSGVLFSFLILTVCLGINLFQYSAVWNMLGGFHLLAHDIETEWDSENDETNAIETDSGQGYLQDPNPVFAESTNPIPEPRPESLAKTAPFSSGYEPIPAETLEQIKKQNSPYAPLEKEPIREEIAKKEETRVPEPVSSDSEPVELFAERPEARMSRPKEAYAGRFAETPPSASSRHEPEKEPEKVVEKEPPQPSPPKAELKVEPVGAKNTGVLFETDNLPPLERIEAFRSSPVDFGKPQNPARSSENHDAWFGVFTQAE